MNLNISNINCDIYFNKMLLNTNETFENSNIIVNILNDDDTLTNQYIDCCISSNGSHYDISLTIYEILKNKFRYVGTNNWEYYDDINKIWKIDDKTERFKYNIRNVVSNFFIARSIFWDKKSKEETDNCNISIDHQLRSVRLLQCSLKLKDNKYILTIIKEAKQFFILQNDE